MRLTILGGYLGAGKTTWLRHRLHAGVFADAHILVNEAAETPVDDALLAGSRVLAGGCACCDGKAALLTALRDLADQESRGRSCDVVLETSGLADPGAIVELVQRDPVLQRHVRMDRVIVLVDALHGLDQLAGEALPRRQIAAADRIVLTKPDLAPAAEVATLAATLRLIAPTAEIVAARMGEEQPLPPEGAAPAILPEQSKALPRPHALHLPPDMDWTALSVWLSALLHARGRDIVRVKGVVRTPAGRLLIQSVRHIVQRPEILPEQVGAGDNILVLIGRGYEPERLERSFRALALGVPT